MEAALPEDPQSTPWEGELRSEYRASLRQLDHGLVEAAERVVQLARPLGEADRRLDEDEAIQARKDADSVQRRVRSLEDDAFGLIARQAPVGPDLREIIATVRALYDVARAARLAVHSVRSLAACAVSGDTGSEHLAEIRTVAADVFACGVSAWRDRDALAVHDLREHDDRITVARDALWVEIQRGRFASSVVPAVLLGRYLERYADHGVALAAHVSWAITGDHVQDMLGGLES